MPKILAIVLLCVAFSVQAKPTAEDIQYCGALSTYVHAVSENKLHNVKKEAAYSTLVKQNGQIAPVLIPGITEIIRIVYDGSFVITSAAERAAIIGEVYKNCLRERK